MLDLQTKDKKCEGKILLSLRFNTAGNTPFHNSKIRQIRSEAYKTNCSSLAKWG